MIGWLSAAAVLGLVLTMKAGVWLRWESGSAVLKLRIGPFRFSFSTGEGKGPKAKAAGKAKVPKAGKKSGGGKKWIRATVTYWQELLILIGRILRTPRLDLLRLHIAVGGKDPEACAMQYGRICAALSGALPLVQRSFRVKKQDIDVICRFDQTETDILAEAEATMKIYEIFALLGTTLGLLLKLYSHTKNTEKAVQSR